MGKNVFVTKYSQLPVNLGKTVLIGEKNIALFKLSNGKVYAIENRCPHREGVLAEGMISGEYVFCPMHNWKIGIVDGVVQEPDEGCVRTFPVKIQNDDIFIVIEDLDSQSIKYPDKCVYNESFNE
ncbi:nitrite reductase small subunit NirD [Terrilactibacillus laevilacticus]|uniref:Nitrite reductase small subunit NirD n=1 Tax=Terrilactibacillus laevilacticus TaxID=1380157 RepID=A0ABW5PVB5_9BACI|nr:nitrite reductase small subunit NirD [Terrilactibacillus laevilacticus]